MYVFEATQFRVHFIFLWSGNR